MRRPADAWAGAQVATAADRGGPRLLNVRQAAVYLGVSYWSVRDYLLAGIIPVVHLPALRPREGERERATLRRVLVDRCDLDRFIDTLKTPVTSPARQLTGRFGRTARRATAAESLDGPAPGR